MDKTKLTTQQQKRILEAAKLLEKGNFGVVEKILEFQDYLEENNVKLNDFFKKMQDEADSYRTMVGKEVYRSFPSFAEEFEKLRGFAERVIEMRVEVDRAIAAVEDKAKASEVREAMNGLSKEVAGIVEELRKVSTTVSKLPPPADLSDIQNQLKELGLGLSGKSPLLSAEHYRDGLESLKGDDRLDMSAVRGLEKIEKKLDEVAKRPAGPGGSARYNSSLIDQDLRNKNIVNIKQATFAGVVDNGNSSTADTINWTAGNIQKSTLTGNCTYTFTAPTGIARLTLFIHQDGTGSRTVTWPATVKWVGGAAPTLTTAASSIDIVTFVYNGTNYFGSASLNFA